MFLLLDLFSFRAAKNQEKRMAATSSSASTASNDEQELKEILDVLWGPNIRTDVFQRWSQGLYSFLYCSNERMKGSEFYKH